MLQPDVFCEHMFINVAKWDCGRGSSPDPTRGAFSAPQTT